MTVRRRNDKKPTTDVDTINDGTVKKSVWRKITSRSPRIGVLDRSSMIQVVIMLMRMMMKRKYLLLLYKGRAGNGVRAPIFPAWRIYDYFLLFARACYSVVVIVKSYARKFFIFTYRSRIHPLRGRKKIQSYRGYYLLDTYRDTHLTIFTFGCIDILSNNVRTYR